MTTNCLSQKIWDKELWRGRMIYFFGVNKSFFQFQHSTSASKPSFQRKQKKFKRQWPNKQRRNQSHSNQRHPNACFNCWNLGRWKANYLNEKWPRKSREIIMMSSETMVVVPSTNSWWVVLAVTHHIARDKRLFLEMKQKDAGHWGQHRGIQLGL